MRPHSFPCAFFAIVAVAGPLMAQSMVNQHVSSGGGQGSLSVDNDRPSISDDNRYVAFASPAANLVAADFNGRSDVFIHDNSTGSTVLISRNPAGAPSDGDSRRPWLSSSGRYVVFQSDATDLVPADTNTTVDVFRHDRDTDGDGIFDEPGATMTIRVSTSSAGAEADGPSRCYSNSVSDSGDVIAFESDATALVAGDTNGMGDCFVKTVSTGVTLRVSVATGGAQVPEGGAYPAISGNGLVAMFPSSSPVLVLGDTNVASDVFIHTIASGVTERVSISASGAEAAGSSWWSSISDNGNRIAFESTAANLVVGDTNGVPDIFVRDVAAGTTVRASVASGGAQAVAGGAHPHIAGNGLSVTFESGSPDLAPGDTNAEFDIFLHRLATVDTERANRAVAGTQADDYSVDASVSDDGTRVAFRSLATNMIVGDVNSSFDIFLRGDTFLGPTAPTMDTDANAVSFSVNGPVDPNTEGIRDARGAPPTVQVPVQPGNPIGDTIRAGPVTQASGIDSIWPGDVFDYDVALVPSEAVIFQSPPLPAPVLPPDGTSNQILEAAGMGLISGPAVVTGMWTAVPPAAAGRDNVDAFSFGEDHFPELMMTTFAPIPPLPLPPAPAPTPWAGRLSVYAEPIVIDQTGGISLRFSVDPWATGLPATAVLVESTGADVGAPFGPWESPGDAAGNVFGTPLLSKLAGATIGGGTNWLVHDNPVLALAPLAASLFPIEDDIDALECVGDNTVPWFGGPDFGGGNLHSRVIHAGPPGMPPPGASIHDPANDSPTFFSVTRNSPGAAFTAVRSQFVIDGGNAADTFVTAKSPMMFPGVGTDLLFMDESEIGLHALSAPPIEPSPLDQTDDLDALILWVCPEYRIAVSTAIDEILGLIPAPGFPIALGGAFPWVPYPVGDAQTGGGMTISICSYLTMTGRPIPPDCIKVGFSVTSDSIGMEYTAVDYEAGPVFPPGGVSAAAGAVFYAVPSGLGPVTNWKWFDAVDLGLDPGGWINGVSMDLTDLPDNLDALDSIDFIPVFVNAYCAPGTTSNGCTPTMNAVGTPSASSTREFSLVTTGVEGVKPGLILYGVSGPAAVPWAPGSTSFLCVTPPIRRISGQTSGGMIGSCDGSLGVDLNAYFAANPGALGLPFMMGAQLWAQAWFRDPPAPAGSNLSNGLEVTYVP